MRNIMMTTAMIVSIAAPTLANSLTDYNRLSPAQRAQLDSNSNYRTQQTVSTHYVYAKRAGKPIPSSRFNGCGCAKDPANQDVIDAGNR